MTASNVPLSILDLSPISEGSTGATALRNSVDLAQRAERWGYRRFWLAEHHFVAAASSRPAIVATEIAAATSTIHVGTGAVQLGQTTAVEVVETFAILASFHPGRIDLGVGRSSTRRRDTGRPPPPQTAPSWRKIDGVVIPPPFDPSALMESARIKTQGAALIQPNAEPQAFADQVADIEAMLTGSYRPDGHELHVAAAEDAGLTPWIFGSSKGESARVAGERGLPFVASYHITPGTALDAVAVYRDHFRPSRHLERPYVVVSADVVVAEDNETAQHLASSYGHWVYSIRSGAGAIPYPDPDRCAPLTDEQRALVEDRTATQFVGDPDNVAQRLHDLQRFTDADELVITSVAYAHQDRLRSHELLAQRWGLSPGECSPKTMTRSGSVNFG
jgi:alkanesulfonate monooxygenase SsuD/methylene tetrahydromethanopterin reductase-like flavin-dependent oxidoreductase (luciferase family)